MNIQTPVRITPCPPRLYLQTSWKGVIVIGKMTFRRAKCLAKVLHIMKTGVLNIPTPVMITPLILHNLILA